MFVLVFFLILYTYREAYDFYSQTHYFMKIFYTTLLITIFIFASQSGYSQNNDYKKFYNSINGAHFSAEMERFGYTEETGVDSETVSPEQIESLINNMSGVIDVSVGGKSLMKPVSTTGNASVPSTFKGLFGCPTTAVRASAVGRPYLDPKIAGVKMVKNTTSANLKKEQAAAIAATNTSKTNNRTASSSVSTNDGPKTKTSSNVIYANNTERTASSAAASAGNEDWKLFKYGDISLLNSSDQAFLKRYSIVLGTFKSRNNADFIRRTFNSMGERSIVVRNAEGNYYALLGSFDTEPEAVQALDNVTKKYTEGISRTRRVSRFGIPLDDMWILRINK